MIDSYFDDWKIEATVRNKTQTPDTDGDWEDAEVNVDTPTILGVKYNLSTGERYFSREWAVDVADAFVTSDITNVTEYSFLLIDSIEYAVEGIIDANMQGELYSIGLRVHR